MFTRIQVFLINALLPVLHQKESKGSTAQFFFSAQPLVEHDYDGTLLNEPKVSSTERQLHILWPVTAIDSIIGFCLPSSCSATDLQTAVAHKIGKTTLRTKT